MVAGDAGSEVTGVSYDSRTHGRVSATVAAGRFALWLPGDELRNASNDGAQVQVTYRDGTTDTIQLTI